MSGPLEGVWIPDIFIYYDKYVVNVSGDHIVYRECQ